MFHTAGIIILHNLKTRLGLIKYVMALMNGARLGIAAQSVGVEQEAYNEGLAYAMPNMGPIMAKVDPEYLDAFHRGGMDCWNHTYLYHELATVIFTRGEEA